MVDYQTIAALVNQIPVDTWDVLREIRERRPAMMLSELIDRRRLCVAAALAISPGPGLPGGSGSRNRAMIASSRSRGGYRSVIRMAAGGTANRTLPDDMGIATRSNVQLWPAPPGRSIGARSVASSSDSPLEQAGFELAVAFAQVSPRTRVASFKAPLSITRPLGNDAGQADMI